MLFHFQRLFLQQISNFKEELSCFQEISARNFLFCIAQPPLGTFSVLCALRICFPFSSLATVKWNFLMSRKPNSLFQKFAPLTPKTMFVCQFQNVWNETFTTYAHFCQKLPSYQNCNIFHGISKQKIQALIEILATATLDKPVNFLVGKMRENPTHYWFFPHLEAIKCGMLNHFLNDEAVSTWIEA